MALAAAMAFSWAAGGQSHSPRRGLRGAPPGRTSILGRSGSALRKFSAVLRICGAKAPGRCHAYEDCPPEKESRPSWGGIPGVWLYSSAMALAAAMAFS